MSEALRGRITAYMAEMDERHEFDEAYDGAGYCSCHDCQLLYPLLFDVQQALRSTAEPDGYASDYDARLAAEGEAVAAGPDLGEAAEISRSLRGVVECLKEAADEACASVVRRAIAFIERDGSALAQPVSDHDRNTEPGV